MNSLRHAIINFYKDTEYTEFRAGVPRPREWHLPKFMHENFNKNVDFFEKYKNGTKIIIPLDEEDMKLLRVTLLHESLFYFYKAFYNYLAAKNLYLSGALHWIEITNYYAKLYLARAINTLCGIQSYRITSDKFIFIEDVFRITNPKRYQTLSNKYNPNKIDYDADIVSYSMHLKLDIKNKGGHLIFDNERVNSHDDTWRIYCDLNHDELEFTKITYEELFDNKYDHLSKARNEENYTFDGYMQIDFNLFNDNFHQYFNRDDTKREAQLVYDDVVGVTLGVFTELFHLYDNLNIPALPIELAKFEHMCKYMIQDKILRDKLVDLCRNKFPLHNKYIEEMNAYMLGTYGD
ncbi:hypothetical protein [Paenibacillus sp. TY11]|uniref:hypothetical protein n=1 Tax=Paenibacillus sp. TY11 TaxID=3448633 RepID=UPI004039B0FA